MVAAATGDRHEAERARAPADDTEAPLLGDALAIAAAARRREPELPGATVRAALAAPIPSAVARYDVVVLPLPETAAGAEVAAGFIAQGHRVFCLTVEMPGSPSPTPPAGSIAVPLLPAAQSEDGVGDHREEVAIGTLAALRRSAGIEAAALVVADPAWDAVARRARERWGWRTVAVPAPDSGDGWRDVDDAVRASFPPASVVVLTYDNLAFTRLCLESVLANTEYPAYELIVVDNASTDGTPAYLHALAARHPRLRVLLNRENRGFGPANNQGLAGATGEILVVLNNDTIVSRGWLTRLARHLEDPRLGLIGPATNQTCNEAQVDAPYQTYGEFVNFARERSAAHDGERLPIRMPMMFCTALRRDVYARVGPLDERFETGLFEDEDYALRVVAAGYEVAWAPDVFVHHAYHASIGKLLPTGQYTALFKANQRRFEEKWGVRWERHRPPP